MGECYGLIDALLKTCYKVSEWRTQETWRHSITVISSIMLASASFLWQSPYAKMFSSIMSISLQT